MKSSTLKLNLLIKYNHLSPFSNLPTHKIVDVKQKLNAEKGFEVAQQKLILRGKNAEDNVTLQDLGVKEGDFMVVMVSKVPWVHSFQFLLFYRNLLVKLNPNLKLNLKLNLLNL